MTRRCGERDMGRRGTAFGAEHHVQWGGLIADAEPTALIALVFPLDTNTSERTLLGAN